MKRPLFANDLDDSGRKKNTFNCFQYLKCALTASHDNSTPERGFSINTFMLYHLG